MVARLSSSTSSVISVKPASVSQPVTASMGAAPPMQAEMASRDSLSESGSGAVATMSEMLRRPPGASTRNASRNTRALSGDRFVTQFDRMASTEESAAGRASISPSRKSTFVYPPLAALRRASSTMSVVMSTPMTCPSGPTCRAARKQSKPPPAPRSRTRSPGFSAAMAVGLPHPRPRLAPSGMVARSPAE